MKLDFSRSSPPCRGPLNISRARPRSPAATWRSNTSSPTCRRTPAAWRRSISSFPTRRCSACRRRARSPAIRNHSSRHRRVFGTFAKAAPERANGSPFATINALSLSGWRAQRRRWIMFCFFGGGLGGNPEGDGLEPCQQSDLYRDHSAGRNSRSALSGHVHALGAAAGFRRCRAGIAAASAPSTRSRRWPRTTPMFSCSASAANFRRSASMAAAGRAQPLRL